MAEYLNAFWFLSERRQNGMSINPISFEAMVKYAEVFGTDDIQEFLLLLARMDREFIKIFADKQQKDSKKNWRD